MKDDTKEEIRISATLVRGYVDAVLRAETNDEVFKVYDLLESAFKMLTNAINDIDED